MRGSATRTIQNWLIGISFDVVHYNYEMEFMIMTQVICLSESKWSQNPERTQRLMTLLGADVDVLFFELTVSKRFFHCLKYRTTGYLRSIAPNITLCRLSPIYYSKDRSNDSIMRGSMRRAVQQIRQQMRENQFEHAVVWADTPLASILLESIPHQELIYDCYRSWDRYPVRLESDLAYRADLVFAASPNLLDHVAPCNENIFLLENGVDFDSAVRDCTADAVISAFPRPIFTYLGDITTSVQINPLIFTAQQHQEWTFVIVGRIQSSNPLYKQLSECKNIQCIGYRQQSNYAECLAAGDACFDLLHNDITDEDVISERMYYYLASGKPIAAMYPLRHNQEFPDVVYGALNEVDFEYACLCASSEGDLYKPELRREYARQADWSIRGECLRGVLSESGLLM